MLCCAPNIAAALPSCGLVQWTQQINLGANTYVASIDTPQNHLATRQFRTLMDKYSRETLLRHINAADLGENKPAYLDFISARHHLLELAQQNWPEMAQRFGDDAKFKRQSAAMDLFLTQTDCIEDPTFQIDASDPDPSFTARFAHWAKSLFSPPPDATVHSAQYRALTFDPENFDTDHSSQTPAAPAHHIVKQSLIVAAAILGLCLMLGVSLHWLLNRHRTLKAARAPQKNATPIFPALIFDGITPFLATCSHVNPKVLRLHAESSLPLHTVVLISLGSFHHKNRTKGPIKRRAIVKQNSDGMIDLKLKSALKPAQLTALTGPFASRFAALHTRLFSQPNSSENTEDMATHSADALQDFLTHTYQATSSMAKHYTQSLSAPQIQEPVEAPTATDKAEDEIEIRSAYEQQNDTRDTSAPPSETLEE